MSGRSPTTRTELRAAADLLRTILARVEAGEMTAPKGVVARLEGAAVLEAVARPTKVSEPVRR